MKQFRREEGVATPVGGNAWGVVPRPAQKFKRRTGGVTARPAFLVWEASTVLTP